MFYFKEYHVQKYHMLSHITASQILKKKTLLSLDSNVNQGPGENEGVPPKNLSIFFYNS